MPGVPPDGARRHDLRAAALWTAVLDEDDLAGRDVLTALLPVAQAVVAEHAPKAIFLGSTCTPEILKMNVAGCAPAIERETGVRVYPARMDGFDASYTEGEDHVLAAMVERSPAGNDANLVILGCLSAIEEAEIRLECRAMGLPVPSFLPARARSNLPPIGEKTVIAPVHPYLYQTCAYAARERGARIPPLIFPYGPDGARAFYETLAAAFGKSVSRTKSASGALGLVRARGRGVARTQHRVLLRRLARSSSLARTLRAAGAHVPFVATPKVYRKFHALESQRLDGVDVLEAPDRFAVFARLMSEHPDLVVANLNIANALEGMGFNVKWSTELTFQPIRGFSGAPALFAMFASAVAPARRAGPRPARASAAKQTRSTSTFSARSAIGCPSASREARRLGLSGARPRRRDEGGFVVLRHSYGACARQKATGTVRSCSRCSNASASCRR